MSERAFKVPNIIFGPEKKSWIFADFCRDETGFFFPVFIGAKTSIERFKNFAREVSQVS